MKALKARNEYLLAIDGANVALKKYFTEDLPMLIEVGNVYSVIFPQCRFFLHKLAVI